MILECIVTTLDGQGALNIAPMGPVVDDDANLAQFVLRPFQSATTFSNLVASRAGVLHVTDNVELLARAAISQWDTLPAMESAVRISGRVLRQANRWYEFDVTSIDDREERSTIQCRTVHRGRRTDLAGLNRAKFAVVEAAILMTRLDFMPRHEIQRQMEQLEVIVEKTAGSQEQRAFRLLKTHFKIHQEALAKHDG